MFELIKKIKKLVIGESWDRHGYKQMVKRVKALPKDYQYVFRKIKHYMITNGVDPYGSLELYTDLVDFFEVSATEGKEVLEVIGNDVGKFCDDLLSTSTDYCQISDYMTKMMFGDINKDIIEKINKEGK